MKTKTWMKILFILAIASMVFSLWYIKENSFNQRTTLEDEYHLLCEDSGWYYLTKDGKKKAKEGRIIYIEDDELTIYKEIYPEQMDENVILFKNLRQAVTIEIEGERIYNLGSGERKFKLSATGYCIADLPLKDRPYTVEITFTNIEDNTVEIPEIYFTSGNDVLIMLYREDFVTFLFTPLWGIVGVCLIALFLAFYRKKHLDYRIISLGVFLVVGITWCLTDTYMTAIMPINYELISAISYYMMMLMPLPILHFVYWGCNAIKLHAKPIWLILILNIIIQSALMIFNVTSLYKMLIVSQALIIFMLMYSAVSTILNYKASKTKVNLVQAIAFINVAFMGLGIIGVYWSNNFDTSAYRTLFTSTLFIFLIAMIIVLLFSLEEHNDQIRKANAEVVAYREISLIDQLTGIKNRKAFDEILNEVDKKPSKYKDITLVFMDLNGLKYTNDKFGHLAGDELIVNAAKAIDYGFKPDGESYRIGGDEFAVVILEPIYNINKYYEKMDEYINEFNKKAVTPLSIARGYARLVNEYSQRLSISDLKTAADKKMYEDKIINSKLKANGTAEAYLEIISSFVSAVDAKDAYTANHSQRVGEISSRICEMLGLSESSRDEIHMAACLHDIGKIGIPDNILSKEGKLTNEEWEIMQSHTIIGEEIIKHNKAFYEVSQIIRHHHERWDGKGYPDGIKGDDIPIGSRIIAIADSIDAMASSRSYRKANTLSHCKKEISDNLGIMYDKAIGTIVLDNWKEIEDVILSIK